MADGELEVELDSLIRTGPPAANPLTEALSDNSEHTFIYPDVPTRQDQSRWLMHVNLGGQLATG